MASYPENTGGIIAAINACILAAGGTVTSYNNNTGGIIQALLALQTAIAGMGGGSMNASAVLNFLILSGCMFFIFCI